MRSMYQCDKCGEIFGDYTECYNHEEQHWDVAGWCREYEKASTEMTTYDKKHFAPVEVGVELNRWSAEEGRTVRAVARYVFKEIFYEDRLLSDSQRAEQQTEETESN